MQPFSFCLKDFLRGVCEMGGGVIGSRQDGKMK